jgi:hypothetical protein
MNGKQRIVLSYGSMNQDQRKLVNKHYPNGFKAHLFAIPKSGECNRAFTLDGGDVVYLVKVEDRYLKSADELINDVEDYTPQEEDWDF